MSDTFVNDRHLENVDSMQLSQQPTVDMGTPVDQLDAVPRLDRDGGGVVAAGMPPLLRSDDVVSAAVKTEVSELKPTNSMPHLMPMVAVTGTFALHKKDDDTENWVPMVSTTTYFLRRRRCCCLAGKGPYLGTRSENITH